MCVKAEETLKVTVFSSNATTFTLPSAFNLDKGQSKLGRWPASTAEGRSSFGKRPRYWWHICIEPFLRLALEARNIGCIALEPVVIICKQSQILVHFGLFWQDWRLNSKMHTNTHCIRVCIYAEIFQSLTAIWHCIVGLTYIKIINYIIL